jgi:hypothetical protein
LRLAPGRRLRTRGAGVLLFLPLWARVRCAQLVSQARAPGSPMVPAPSALWSVLSLKLLDTARRSPLHDLTFAAAVGLVAGLHGPPKQSSATADSSRTGRDQQHKLLSGWIGAVAPVLFPQATPCSLDLPPLPFRGDATGLAQPSLPRRGTAGTSRLSCCAHEHDSPVVCSANAPLLRRDQAGAALQCVAFWPALTGSNPQWRYVASKVVPSPALAQLHQRGLWCVTIRRRGAAILRRLSARPASPWRQAVIDTAHRRHHHSRSLEETVPLPGDKGSRRQRAVTGLGRAPPPGFLSNNMKERARALMVRYASRHRVEDGLGSRVHGFHLDCVARAGRLHVALDPTMTVRAHGGYRGRAKPRRGFDTAAPKPLYRPCVATGGGGEIQPERIVVHFDTRCHNPILREAALDQPSQGLPWLRHLPVVFQDPGASPEDSKMLIDFALRKSAWKDRGKGFIVPGRLRLPHS